MMKVTFILQVELEEKYLESHELKATNIILHEKLQKAEAKLIEYCKSVKEAKPSYCIMTNNSLDIISRKQPTTVNELLEIKGIGKTFIDKYSEDVLEIIKEAIK